MRILFAARFLPHPDVRDSGGLDSYHYIKSLAQKHEVSLIAFASRQQTAAVAAMRQICRHVVPVPYRHQGLLPRLGRAAGRLLLPRVYGRNLSRRYWHELQTVLAQEAFDVVVVDGMMAPYGLLLRGPARILDEVDIYGVVAYQDYLQGRNPLQRRLDYLDWVRTYLAELEMLRRYEGVLTRSQTDAHFVRRLLPRKPVHVAAPWFEGLEPLQQVAAQRPPGHEILFVGAMQNQKNIQAALFFANEVLPLIHEELPDAVFNIVGGSPPPEICALSQRPGIMVTGEVADLTPYYRQSAVNVAPLLTGGGIIVKTLNGMAAARPTVATPLGNGGTGAQPGRDLLVAPAQPRPLAAAVLDVLTNQTLWQTLADNGRAFVRAHYDWSANIAGLERFMAQLPPSSPPN